MSNKVKSNVAPAPSPPPPANFLFKRTKRSLSQAFKLSAILHLLQKHFFASQEPPPFLTLEQITEEARWPLLDLIYSLVRPFEKLDRAFLLTLLNAE